MVFLKNILAIITNRSMIRHKAEHEGQKGRAPHVFTPATI